MSNQSNIIEEEEEEDVVGLTLPSSERSEVEEFASVVEQVSQTEEERGVVSSQESGGGESPSNATQNSPDLPSTSEEETNPKNGAVMGVEARRASETPSSLPYSKTFYCPLSGSLLQDPVVLSDGISYNRNALEGRGDDMSKVYENRSLKAIIDEAVEYQKSSALKRLGLNVRQLSQQLLVTPYNRPLPEGFYCPITLSLIHVPVIDPEGYSYEKLAIENWIRCNGASPVTRRTMTIEELYPNKTLAALMMEEKGKSDDAMHPLIKQWKEEPLPIVPADIERAIVTTGTPPVFPSTPEELEAANRHLRMRRCNRFIFWTLLTIVLGTLSWMVPVISTVILVFVLIGIGAMAWCSSNSLSTFGGDTSSSGLRRPPPPRRLRQRQPVAPSVHEV